MSLKSYFAGTVESAICLAPQEMGGEGMLVSSRRPLPEARHLGAYEVVFAAAQDPLREAAAAALQAPAEESASPPAQTLAGEMAEIRRQLAKMSLQVSRSGVRAGPRASPRSKPALDGPDDSFAPHAVDGGLPCSILWGLESLGPPAP